MKYELRLCTVCGLLDQDFSKKECAYCSLCDSWICKADIPNLVRRALAMYKQKALKLKAKLMGYSDSGFAETMDFGVAAPIVMQAVGGSHAANANLGGVMASGVDSGGTIQNFGICSGFVTPNASSTVSSVNVWVDTVAGSGLWGTAIYADNGGTPTGGALIAGVTSSSVPSTSGWTTLTPSGIGTLAANTQYWVCFVTTSASRTIGENAGGSGGTNNVCSNGKASFFSTSVLGSPFTSWPSTFPASSENGNGCYSVYVTLSYTSTAQYDIVSAGGGATDAVQSVGVYHIPPTGSNSTLVIAQSFGNTSPAFADSAGDTVNTLGTCSVATSPNGQSVCMAAVNRVSAGVTNFTITNTPSVHCGAMFVEVAGTISSSFDQVAYDTVGQSSPFTSAATGTTAQANEFQVGMLTSHSGGYPTCTIGGSSGWQLLYYGVTTGNVPTIGMALFGKTVSSIGTYSLTGTETGAVGCGAAGQDLTAIATFK